jgi:hypothetical protein
MIPADIHHYNGKLWPLPDLFKLLFSRTYILSFQSFFKAFMKKYLLWKISGRHHPYPILYTSALFYP